VDTKIQTKENILTKKKKKIDEYIFYILNNINSWTSADIFKSRWNFLVR
jgi:hypothetical protein